MAKSEMQELWEEIGRLRRRIAVMETREGGAGVSDHGALSGLADDDHGQYARLAGRSAGQSLVGGTAAGDDLTLESTGHATKGDVLIQPNGGAVGIGTNAPAGRLMIRRSDGGMLLDVGPYTITEGATTLGTGFQRLGSDQDVVLGIIKPDATGALMYTGVNGDSYRRFNLRSDGRMSWGPGSAGRDVELYRSAADVLTSDDRLAAYGYGLTGSKASVANNTATVLCDIVMPSGTIMYSLLAGLTVSGSGVSSGQLWAVTGGWNAVTVTKLSEGLYGHSSIVLTGGMTTGTRTLRLTVTQINGSAVACTVNLSLLPLIGGANIISSLTMV